MSMSAAPPSARDPQPATRRPRRWPWITGLVAAFAVGGAAGAAGAIGAAEDGPVARPAAVTAPATSVTTVTATETVTQTITESYTEPALPPETETVTVEEEAPAAASPPDPGGGVTAGVYQVGADIEPGRYRTDGPAPGGLGFCYWSRNTDDSGEFESIISNGALEGPGSVTVGDGEFLELSGDCVWTHAG